MFGGRFGLMRFGLRDRKRTLEKEIFETYTANLNAFITFADNLHANENYSASMQINVTVVPGLLAKEKYISGLTVNAVGATNYRANEEYNAIMQSNVVFVLNYNTLEEYSSEMQSSVNLVSNHNISEEYIANLISQIITNTNFNSNEVYTATMFAIINISVLEYETVVITVSIPSKSELRIDSENYEVTLNGENIIHQHSGAWITLSRNIVDMLISSSAGGLEGKLLYTERYL